MPSGSRLTGLGPGASEGLDLRIASETDLTVVSEATRERLSGITKTVTTR